MSREQGAAYFEQSEFGYAHEPLNQPLECESATGNMLRRFLGKWFWCHPMVILMEILLMVVLTLAVALAVQSAPQVPVPSAAPVVVLGCPSGWVGYNGVCYYLSRDHSSWEQGQERCSELGASLAVAKDEEHMRLLLHLAGNVDYWLGLRMWDERLQWEDGRNYTFSSRFPVDGNSKCVYLAEHKLRSVDCSNPQPYVCSKAQAPL